MAETCYGYCECGCGQETERAAQTRVDRGWIKGEPKRFVRGHKPKREGPRPQCAESGCGKPVLARKMCRAHYLRWSKAQNPEKFKAYQETYDERHPGRRLEHARARYAKDPTKHKEYVRRSLVKREYGLELEEYKAILARGCAICGSEGPRMALDHCHTTGRVRDALCTSCNNGLGRFKDDPALMRAAADYIEAHRA
jgi:hypothetical protein